MIVTLKGLRLKKKKKDTSPKNKRMLKVVPNPDYWLYIDFIFIQTFKNYLFKSIINNIN